MQDELSQRAREILEVELADRQRRMEEAGRFAAKLRALLATVEEELALGASRCRELEEALGTSSQLPIAALDGELSGSRLREVAVELLRESRPDGEPIHYRDWLALLTSTGARISGKDPTATFLATVTKSSEIESVRPRSGLYQLRTGT